MAIPAEGYPRTAAISPRVQVVDMTDSTNADVIRHATDDPTAWPHLSLLLTTDQRAGRGRLDRSWTTPPGTALAVSVLVRVPGIPPAARGWIPLVAGTAMSRAIAEQLRGNAQIPELKWPNDVLLSGGKVCGILAEVLPGDSDAIVIGTGVNTRMPRADLPVPTATSFQVLGLEVDDDRLVADYLSNLRDLLAALEAASGDAEASGIHAIVSAACGTLGRSVVVSLPDGSQLEGTADRLDAAGRLVVARLDDRGLGVDGLGVDGPGGEHAVSAGDVIHIR